MIRRIEMPRYDAALEASSKRVTQLNGELWDILLQYSRPEATIAMMIALAQIARTVPDPEAQQDYLEWIVEKMRLQFKQMDGGHRGVDLWNN